jgi:hypothetical protein
MRLSKIACDPYLVPEEKKIGPQARKQFYFKGSE